jgi:hypothetical protein
MKCKRYGLFIWIKKTLIKFMSAYNPGWGRGMVHKGPEMSPEEAEKQASERRLIEDTLARVKKNCEKWFRVKYNLGFFKIIKDPRLNVECILLGSKLLKFGESKTLFDPSSITITINRGNVSIEFRGTDFSAMPSFVFELTKDSVIKKSDQYDHPINVLIGKVKGFTYELTIVANPSEEFKSEHRDDIFFDSYLCSLLY